MQDTIILRGRQIQGAVATGGGGTFATVTLLSIANLGGRVSSVGANYLRFRFLKLVARFKSALGDGVMCTPTPTLLPISGSAALGFADDTANTAAALTTANQVLNLRCSTHFKLSNNAVVSWSPLDRNKWYYVNPESSASDDRWIIPCALALITDVASDQAISLTLGSLDLEYVVEFSGATDVAV